MANPVWDVGRYQSQHSFVWEYGESLIDLLSPQPTERILDLGCGSGQLTHKLSQSGAWVEGIDADPAMIAQAKQNYPQLSFRVADAQRFTVEQPYDAVFSNAVLHWIQTPEPVIQSVWQALRPGGRFVAEFGGKGNVQQIITAVHTVLGGSEFPLFWYFPSVAEYAAVLEAQGFEVTFATLFDRPTPLAEGDQGLANWLRMFGGQFWHGLSEADISQAIEKVEARLKPSLYQGTGWIADYRRLRIMALKTAGN